MSGKNSRHHRIILASGIAAWALVAPRSAAAQCLPGVTCKFSVTGKDGNYLQTGVTPADLQKADSETQEGLSDGRSLDSVSLNKGENAGTGIRMPLAEAQLATMLARIGKVWPYRAPPPISVRILGSTAYAPAAHPDNVITVPLGLLINARSDDEVAWVLAHEFSHIALAHFSREAKQRRLQSGVERAIDCTRLGLAFADMRASKSGNQITLYNNNDPGLAAASTQVWAKGGIVNSILGAYNQHLSRRQEDRADAAGLDLVLKANYSDEGYGTALNFLKAEDDKNGSLLKQFGSDLGIYMKQASSQSAAGLIGGAGATGVFSALTSGIAHNAEHLFLKKMQEVVLATHRPPAKRLEGLGKYMDTAYPNFIAPKTSTEWLVTIRRSSEYAEAQIAVNAVDASLHAIPITPCAAKDDACVAHVQAGIIRALTAIAPAEHGRYAATPLVANAEAHLLADAGRQAEADNRYTQADNAGAAPAAALPARRKARGRTIAPPPAPRADLDPYLTQSLSGFSDHVDLLLRMKAYAKALRVIDLAKSRFQDDDKFLPALVTIAVQTNNSAMLVDAIKRCGATEDESLRASCNIAFLAPDQQDKFDQLPPADKDKYLAAFDAASASVKKGSICGMPSITPPDAKARKASETDS